MSVEKKSFIVSHYTTSNGTKLTREQVANKVMDKLSNGPLTCGSLARTLKLKKQSIYNVLAWMWNQKMVTKKKSDRGIYEYFKVQDCLLSKLFHPTPAQVEKQFKILGRKSYKVENGTSKGFGGKGITKYSEHYFNSVLWEGVD